MNTTDQQWFIDPRNPSTNERLSKELAELGQVNESEIQSLEICTARGKHDTIKAWRVLHGMVATLVRARKYDPTLVFRIFTRKGAAGVAYEWTFEGKKKSSKKVVDAKKQLADRMAKQRSSKK